MLVDIYSIEEAVRFAQKIARKMSNDPEVDSIAAEAAWKALYTYDIKRNVKLSWWIAQLAKQSVQYYWRKQKALREREMLMDELWWRDQAIAPPSEDGPPICQADWQLLIESFVLGWPMDVLAREHGVSISQVANMRRAAISRLEKEASCSTSR